MRALLARWRRSSGRGRRREDVVPGARRTVRTHRPHHRVDVVVDAERMPR